MQNEPNFPRVSENGRGPAGWPGSVAAIVVRNKANSQWPVAGRQRPVKGATVPNKANFWAWFNSPHPRVTLLGRALCPGWHRPAQLGDGSPGGEGVSPLRVAGILPAISRARGPRRERARPGWPRHARPSPRPSALTMPPAQDCYPVLNQANFCPGETKDKCFAGRELRGIGYANGLEETKPICRAPTGAGTGRWGRAHCRRWDKRAKRSQFCRCGYLGHVDESCQMKPISPDVRKWARAGQGA